MIPPKTHYLSRITAFPYVPLVYGASRAQQRAPTYTSEVVAPIFAQNPTVAATMTNPQASRNVEFRSITSSFPRMQSYESGLEIFDSLPEATPYLSTGSISDQNWPPLVELPSTTTTMNVPILASYVLVESSSAEEEAGQVESNDVVPYPESSYHDIFLFLFLPILPAMFTPDIKVLPFANDKNVPTVAPVFYFLVIPFVSASVHQCLSVEHLCK